MKKLKIAEFFGEPLNYGGQESFILNIYSKINKSNFNFTFITPFECQNKKLIKMIEEKKDTLIFDNKKFETNARKDHIIRTAKRYLNNEYDVVHIHSGSVFTLYNVAKIAKKNGIKKVIVHSHATGVNTLKYKLIKFLSDLNINKYVDYYLACSDDAAKWKYPKKIINSSKYIVVKNGIDIQKFKYNVDIRNKYRKKYELKDKNIICTIGRFAFEKNVLFTLKVFKEYLKIDKKGFLLMIGGSGNLEEELHRFIKCNKLENLVLILKNRDDINNFLSMSDVFIMPSLWEGLGMAAIEAQASGLNILCSTNIPTDVNITPLFHRQNLSDGEEKWAKEVKKIIKKERIDYSDLLKKSGFDITNATKKIEQIYCE